jgi:hypothetical protein
MGVCASTEQHNIEGIPLQVSKKARKRDSHNRKHFAPQPTRYSAGRRYISILVDSDANTEWTINLKLEAQNFPIGFEFECLSWAKINNEGSSQIQTLIPSSVGSNSSDFKSEELLDKEGVNKSRVKNCIFTQNELILITKCCLKLVCESCAMVTKAWPNECVSNGPPFVRSQKIEKAISTLKKECNYCNEEIHQTQFEGHQKKCGLKYFEKISFLGNVKKLSYPLKTQNDCSNDFSKKLNKVKILRMPKNSNVHAFADDEVNQSIMSATSLGKTCNCHEYSFCRECAFEHAPSPSSDMTKTLF